MVAGHLAGLAGSLAFDLRDEGRALAYFKVAVQAADDAGSPDLAAWALATRSLIPTYTGDPAAALRLRLEAQDRARGHVSPSRLPVLAAGILEAFAGITVEDFEAQAEAFLRSAQHPTLGRGYLACAYAPMVELLGYLAANGFANYVASGGGRDFMRPVSQELYGVPRQRVIGSSTALAWEPGEGGGRIVRKPEADVLDDGPAKPVRVWSRVGRRPILAAGNSNGDLPMLQFAERPGHPSLRLLVLHDDPEREFGYTAGAEQALGLARASGWTVVSINHDWTTIF